MGGVSQYTYNHRNPVKRSSKGRMLSEARSIDSKASLSGSVGSLELNDDVPLDGCPPVATVGLSSCVDSCAAACESDCQTDVSTCLKQCSTSSCSDTAKTDFTEY